MPIVKQGATRAEDDVDKSTQTRVNKTNNILSSIGAALMQTHMESWIKYGVIPWYFEAGTPLWMRYNEVAVGRRDWLNCQFEPYESIPATYSNLSPMATWKREYFRDKQIAIDNGVKIRSLRQDNEGKIHRNIDIDFTVKYSGSASAETDGAEVTIYNVDPQLDILFEEAPIIIRSGYWKFNAPIFSGVTGRALVESEEDTIKITLNALTDFIKFMGYIPIEISYPQGTKYMSIINDLLSMVPVPIGYIQQTDEVTTTTYTSDGYSTTILDMFNAVAGAIGYKLEMSGGKLNFYPDSKESWEKALGTDLRGNLTMYPQIHLSALNGLIDVRKNSDEQDYEYNVTTLLIPYFNVNTWLQINTPVFGELSLAAKELEYRSNETEHYVVMKCNELILSSEEG